MSSQEALLQRKVRGAKSTNKKKDKKKERTLVRAMTDITDLRRLKDVAHLWEVPFLIVLPALRVLHASMRIRKCALYMQVNFTALIMWHHIASCLISASTLCIAHHTPHTCSTECY